MLATVRLTNQRDTTFNVLFDTSGDVAIAAKTTTGDLIKSLRQAQEKSGLSSTFYPLVPHATMVWQQVTLGPQSSFSVQLERDGNDAGTYIALRWFDLAAAIAKVAAGIDIGDKVNGNPLLGSDVVDQLLSSLGNAGFDLAAAADRFRSGDVQGAISNLVTAISDSPEILADAIGVGSDAVKTAASDVARLLQVIDVVPYATDVTFGPSNGTVAFSNPATAVLPSPGETGGVGAQALLAVFPGAALVPPPSLAPFSDEPYLATLDVDTGFGPDDVAGVSYAMQYAAPGGSFSISGSVGKPATRSVPADCSASTAYCPAYAYPGPGPLPAGTPPNSHPSVTRWTSGAAPSAAGTPRQCGAPAVRATTRISLPRAGAGPPTTTVRGRSTAARSSALRDSLSTRVRRRRCTPSAAIRPGR